MATVERILRISIAELKIVRLTCKKCGTTIEVPIEKIGLHGRCAYCPDSLFTFGNPTRVPAEELAKAIQNLNDMHERLGFEFVIPEPT